MKATATLCPLLVCSVHFVIGAGWRKLVRCLCHWCWVEEAFEILMLLMLGGGRL